MTASLALRTEQHPRALRLPIRTVLQYRCGNDESWHRGNCLNASFTGMLVGVSRQLRLDDTTTLRLSLPRELAGAASPVVEIIGRVARHAGANRFGIRFLHATVEQTTKKPPVSTPRAASGFHSLMHDLSIIVGSCDLLEHATLHEPTGKAVRAIKRAAMKATETLRKGAE
jgi:hypothetical protein